MYVWGVGVLAAGQSSTMAGCYAGQFVMEVSRAFSALSLRSLPSDTLFILGIHQFVMVPVEASPIQSQYCDSAYVYCGLSS